MDSSIQYIPHQHIDKLRWNACIDAASNGLIYALSEYLDVMSPGWNALVLGDYEAVMPLLVKKKYGINYLHQPFQVAQTGVFFSYPYHTGLEENFLQTAWKHVKYGSIDFNEHNQLSSTIQARVQLRTNYVLNLSATYTELYSHYNEDGKKNLRRAARYPQQTTSQVSIEQVVQAYQQQYGDKNQSANSQDYHRFTTLFHLLQKRQLAFCTGVCDSHSSELLAVAAFGNYRNRLYYLLGAPTEKGKQHKSVHVLIDELIKQYAETGFLLDFEGSDIPSVANFYEKFGPEKRIYPSVFFNHLPIPIRWLKK